MNMVPGEASCASPLLTDLYQLTMLDAYYRLGKERPAVFEFAVRRLPHARNYLVAAGLEQVQVGDTHEICSPTSACGTEAAITIFIASGRKPAEPRAGAPSGSTT